MKHQLTMLSMACGLLCLFGTGASAQSSYRLASDVPFAFHVGEENCASGQYTIEKSAAHAYQIMRGQEGCSFLLGYGIPLSGKSQPKLVFHRYHDQYFLSEIWSGNGTGSRLSISKREQEVREQAQPSETAITTLYLMSKR